MSTHTAASMIELLHTATLVHDDVVDDAHQRRGFFSINALWKNKIAVLVGDYLLSKGLLLAVEKKEFDLLQILSNAVQEMSEGELLQLAKSRKMDITEAIYFDIIRKKTATLISACCAAGATSVKATAEEIEKMKSFGEYVGIAFQLKDDLLDYCNTNKLGKPIGNDIKEKKLTLPLIHALQTCSANDKKQMIYLIKNHKETNRKLGIIHDFVRKTGGLAYAEEKMHLYKQKALDILAEFPQNAVNTALENLILFSIERTQ